MYDRIVSDGYVITDGSDGFLIGTMYHGAVLNIGIIANADGVYIPANNRIKPNGAMFPGLHIAYDGGIRGYPIVFSEGRGNPFYW
jgi:hypothetical protein